MSRKHSRAAIIAAQITGEDAMLTETEIETLNGLLSRAITSDQFSVGVASPFTNPEDDLFDEGDRHDGNCAGSTGWKTYPALTSTDGEERETPTIKLLIDQSSIDHIGRSADADMADLRLIEQRDELLDTVKALVKHMLTHNIDGGQAIFDAGGLLDRLGVPRDFYRTEEAQP